ARTSPRSSSRSQSCARTSCGRGRAWLSVRPGSPRSSRRDRKSTRLNSSHVSISYAVFCLKKKKEVHLEAPLRTPRKFLGLGLSFKSHVAELRAKKIPITIPPHHVWFNKPVTAINAPYDPI